MTSGNPSLCTKVMDCVMVTGKSLLNWPNSPWNALIESRMAHPGFWPPLPAVRLMMLVWKEAKSLSWFAELCVGMSVCTYIHVHT